MNIFYLYGIYFLFSKSGDVVTSRIVLGDTICSWVCTFHVGHHPQEKFPTLLVPLFYIKFFNFLPAAYLAITPPRLISTGFFPFSFKLFINTYFNVVWFFLCTDHGIVSLLFSIVSSLYCLYVCSIIVSIYMYKKRAFACTSVRCLYLVARCSELIL